MLKHKIISSLSIIAGLATTSFAYADVVKLPLEHSDGKFHCIVNTWNPTASVSIDTSRVKVKGFCKGYSKHVTADGHIKDLNVTTLSKYYFVYKEDGGSDQFVTFTTSTDNAITCAEGPGDRTVAYGEDGDFC